MHVQVLLVAECAAMFGTLTPVVRAVLYANVIVFGLQWLTGPSLLPAFFALWPLDSARLTGVPFEPWQLVTYAFLHEGFWHIAGNMFALYVFGPDVELLLGARRFTLYYFVCVIGAALTQLWVVQYVYPTPYPTLGASGGIFGLLLFYGMAFPHRRMLLLIPPIPNARLAAGHPVWRAGAGARRVRQFPGHRALRASGWHGDRLSDDSLLALAAPPALAQLAELKSGAGAARCAPL